MKVKKERRDSEAQEDKDKADEQSWEDKTMFLCPIARPLASKKLAKRLYKTIKKGR